MCIRDRSQIEHQDGDHKDADTGYRKTGAVETSADQPQDEDQQSAHRARTMQQAVDPFFNAGLTPHHTD
jgi:hypothetical protein